MIASNYIKHPEALRFQCEMFSNGYHNSPRIMRLMGVIFDQRPDVPQWFKDMRSKAKALVKKWKKQMVDMFKPEAKAMTEQEVENQYFAPILHASNHSQEHLKASGNYRNFCRKCDVMACFTYPWHYGAGPNA